MASRETKADKLGTNRRAASLASGSSNEHPSGGTTRRHPAPARPHGKTPASRQAPPLTKDQITQVECLNINDEETLTGTSKDLEATGSAGSGPASTTMVGQQQQQQHQQRISTGSFSSMSTAEDLVSRVSMGQTGRDDISLIGRGGPSDQTPIRQQLNKNLIFATLISGMGSAFQHGYNGGVVNAPEKLIAQFINETKQHEMTVTGNGINGPSELPSEAEIDFIFSLIVSFFCIGGCLGALLTAPVADRLGRREGLFYNCLLVLLACPMMASARSFHSYKLLIFGRFLIGINAGLNAGLAPLYLNEIAPIGLRGAFGTVYQLILTLSICQSNILGLPSLLGTADLWPFLFLFPILPAGFMMATLPHCCESPKFLLLVQGRELQAQQALAWFRGTADGIQEEMEDLRSEQERNRHLPAITLGQMWRQSSLSRPLTISMVIMLSQQFSGINAILFYSTSIFRDAGLNQAQALHATLGMSATNVLMTAVSLVLVDRAGRKTLHMTGLLGMAISCLVLALCLGPNATSAIADDQPGSPASLLAVLSVYSFIIMFASGPGSIPWFLVGELFPSNARPLASSIAVSVNWLANFTVTLCFLPLVNLLHGYTFFIFAGLLVFFYLYTYFRVPETKGATAEEISALFVR